MTNESPFPLKTVCLDCHKIFDAQFGDVFMIAGIIGIACHSCRGSMQFPNVSDKDYPVDFWVKYDEPTRDEPTRHEKHQKLLQSIELKKDE